MLPKKKEIVYVDLDGVIIDSHKAIVEAKKTGIPVPLSDCPPIEGAIESLHKLAEHFDVLVLSTARWSDPNNWGDRLVWLKENGLEELLFKKVTLTHRKDLLKGRYLVDDSTANGAGEFSGEHIHFSTERFPNWDSVVKYLMLELEKPSVTSFALGFFPSFKSTEQSKNFDSTYNCPNCGKTVTSYGSPCSKSCWMQMGGLENTGSKAFKPRVTRDYPSFEKHFF